MDVPGVAGLLGDLKVAVLLPAGTYVAMTLFNRALSLRFFGALFQRIALMFALALFLVFLPALMWQDRPVLIALWRQKPLLYSLIYLLFGAGISAGVAGLCYWRLRPSRWRPNTEQERRLAEEYARARAEKRRLYRLDGDPPPEDGAEPEKRG